MMPGRVSVLSTDQKNLASTGWMNAWGEGGEKKRKKWRTTARYQCIKDSIPKHTLKICHSFLIAYQPHKLMFIKPSRSEVLSLQAVIEDYIHSLSFQQLSDIIIITYNPPAFCITSPTTDRLTD